MLIKSGQKMKLPESIMDRDVKKAKSTKQAVYLNKSSGETIS